MRVLSVVVASSWVLTSFVTVSIGLCCGVSMILAISSAYSSLGGKPDGLAWDRFKDKPVLIMRKVDNAVGVSMVGFVVSRQR